MFNPFNQSIFIKVMEAVRLYFVTVFLIFLNLFIRIKTLFTINVEEYQCWIKVSIWGFITYSTHLSFFFFCHATSSAWHCKYFRVFCYQGVWKMISLIHSFIHHVPSYQSYWIQTNYFKTINNKHNTCCGNFNWGFIFLNYQPLILWTLFITSCTSGWTQWRVLKNQMAHFTTFL